MKLVSSRVSVCFNYSTSFSNNDFSSFKNSTKEARPLRNDILSTKLLCHKIIVLVYKLSPTTLRLLQTFVGVPQIKIRTRAVFNKTPTNYIPIERL